MLFVDVWNPFSLAMAKDLAALRQSANDIYIVELSRNYAVATNYGVYCSPTLLVFVNGKPAKIKRNGWEDDYKCKLYADMGITSRENLETLVAAARASAGVVDSSG